MHQPDEQFETTLVSLRDQDYPNLRHLFLVTDGDEATKARILAVLPDALVRLLKDNPGFPAAANRVLKLIEGQGFFCFCHDDVVLDPDAMSRLVEELYRSNAGIVGPKLVDWDDPRVVVSVGHQVDRFGELHSEVEPGELDQEQHDAVRDVFKVGSACLLIRADLFRSLGGFADGSEFHGDALDLCWRAHLTGARVIVVPAARVRHRAGLAVRRGDLSHRRMEAVARARTVATLTGRWRTPVVLLQFVIVGVVELIVGILTGRPREGAASLYGLARLIPARVARPAAGGSAPLRVVPDTEIAMQLGGERPASYFFRQLRAQRRRVEAVVKRSHGDRLPAFVGLWSPPSSGRQLIAHGPRARRPVRPLPAPGGAWQQFVSHGETHRSSGSALRAHRWRSSPSRLGARRTDGALAMLGVLAPSASGAWRALAFVPSRRARLGGALVCGGPLPYTAIATGRWGVLAAYGGLPWIFRWIRRAGGLVVLDGSGWGDDEIADAVAVVSPRELARSVAGIALVTALVGSFAPAFLLVVPLVAVVVLLGTALAGGSRTVLTATLVAIVGTAGSALLLGPFAGRFLDRGEWDWLVGPTFLEGRSIGWQRLLSLSVGPRPLGILAIGLYVPVLAGPLVARGWRLTWAARAAALVIAFLVLVLLDDRAALPIRLPEPGLLLVPVALGLAISAACALAGFERDIRAARFGWRQPLGLLMSVALV
ncbi:MAG: glycosyltransferase, partial [Ilumatobacteraceae bacterium]